MVSLLVVDDHPMVRSAMEATLARAFGGATVASASSMAEAEERMAAAAELDLVLLDLNIPGAAGFSGLVRLRGTYPRVPILVVSGMDDPRFQAEARAAGAAGFVSKAADPEEIVAATQAVLDGETYWTDEVDDSSTGETLSAALTTLTPQQLRVLELLGQGLLNKQIAHELDIVESTVKAHVSAILRKLNVHSRTQAVLLAQRVRFSEIEGAAFGGPAAN